MGDYLLASSFFWCWKYPGFGWKKLKLASEYFGHVALVLYPSLLFAQEYFQNDSTISRVIPCPSLVTSTFLWTPRSFPEGKRAQGSRPTHCFGERWGIGPGLLSRHLLISDFMFLSAQSENHVFKPTFPITTYYYGIRSFFLLCNFLHVQW